MALNNDSSNYLSLVALLLSSVFVGCSDDTPSVTVTIPPPVNDTPLMAISQSLTTTLNSPLEITLQGSGPNPASLSFEVTDFPQNGTLTGQLSGVSPTMTYMPNQDFFGDDSYEFAVMDGSGSSATGTISISIQNTISGSTDSDGDGLTDLDELSEYGTNPNLIDTDADGFDDFMEIVTLGFDADGNRLRFNPLIADTPRIAINLVSTPEIQINYTETDGSSSSVSTNRSQSSSSSFTRSDSSEVSNSFEYSYEESISVGNDDGLGFLGASAEFTATQTLSEEETVGWSEEQTNENSTTLDQAESFETSKEISAGDGQISIVATIRNPGHLSYTVTDLILSSTYFDLDLNEPVVAIGNLDFDTVQGAFPNVALGPGQSTGPLNYIASNINLQTIKRLLGDSRGLTVRPAVFNLLDENGRSFNFDLAGIQAQNASIVVDFGVSSGRESVNEWVAVNGDPTAKLSVFDALTSTLGLDIGMSAVPGVIASVDGIDNAPILPTDPTGSRGVWVLIHVANTGTNQFTTTVYTTPEQETRIRSVNPLIQNLVSSYDLSTMEVHGGDRLALTFIEDTDLDGLGDRTEFFYRTDPTLADTDADGLTDREEVDGWDVTYLINSAPITFAVSSNPLQMDSDSDGLADVDEAFLAAADPALSRNPMTQDTDGDGIPDADDDFSTTIPIARLPNEFDPTDITTLSATFNTAPPAASPSVALSYAIDDVIVGNNIDDYRVLILRFNNELEHSVIPFPDPGPIDDTNYLVGTRISCDPSLLGEPMGRASSATCDWVVADNFIADASTLPTTHAFDDASISVDTTNGSAGLGTGPFKYIAYVQINGHFQRSSELVFASDESEIIQIRMMGGRLRNNDPIAGDQRFNANVKLKIDGKLLADGLDPNAALPTALTREVTFSDQVQSVIATTASGLGWDIFAELDPALQNPAVAGGGDINAGGGWNFIDSAVEIVNSLDQTIVGAPVYEFRVSATEGCHDIRLEVAEFDSNFDGLGGTRWQLVSFPSLVESGGGGIDLIAAVDTATLCRDNGVAGAGVWTITSKLPNTDPKAASNGILGSAPSPTSGLTSATGFAGSTTTQTGSIFPIQYQSRPLLWNYFTPTGTTGVNPNNQSGDIRVRYDVFVQVAP